jgi:hypothetical protein
LLPTQLALNNGCGTAFVDWVDLALTSARIIQIDKHSRVKYYAPGLNPKKDMRECFVISNTVGTHMVKTTAPGRPTLSDHVLRVRNIAEASCEQSQMFTADGAQSAIGTCFVCGSSGVLTGDSIEDHGLPECPQQCILCLKYWHDTCATSITISHPKIFAAAIADMSQFRVGRLPLFIVRQRQHNPFSLLCFLCRKSECFTQC